MGGVTYMQTHSAQNLRGISVALGKIHQFAKYAAKGYMRIE